MNGSTPQPDPDPGSGLNRRVLIVDDSSDGCTALALLLELHGFQARCTQSGAETLAFLEQHHGDPPEIVLLDLRLPDIDGCELARQIRPLLPHARIILVTGWDRPDIDLAACGIDSMILKPIEAQVLLRRLAVPELSDSP